MHLAVDSSAKCTSPLNITLPLHVHARTRTRTAQVHMDKDAEALRAGAGTVKNKRRYEHIHTITRTHRISDGMTNSPKASRWFRNSSAQCNMHDVDSMRCSHKLDGLQHSHPKLTSCCRRASRITIGNDFQSCTRDERPQNQGNLPPPGAATRTLAIHA